MNRHVILERAVKGHFAREHLDKPEVFWKSSLDSQLNYLTTITGIMFGGFTNFQTALYLPWIIIMHVSVIIMITISDSAALRC